MSVQRKLNALLFELQAAESPLAQAKILARSWRTLRELSPTDRRLLARHAGFEGAEQILEGLASKQKGFAPATLLQMLNTFREADGAAVGDLMAALRDPSRRGEIVDRGAEMAVDLLRQDDREDGHRSIRAALDELQARKEGVQGSPEEALAALTALETTSPKAEAAPPLHGQAREESRDPVPRADHQESEEGPKPGRPAPEPMRTSPEKTARPVRRSPRTTALSEGWDHLGEGRRREPSTHGSRSDGAPVAKPPRSSRFDAPAVFAALGAESSSFSRLRVLDREMKGFVGSSPDTIRELLDAFPDGWVRRRALAALIKAGVLSDPSQALQLVGELEREVDRLWCLGALARQGALSGPLLLRSLAMVNSSAGRRRLQFLADLR